MHNNKNSIASVKNNPETLHAAFIKINAVFEIKTEEKASSTWFDMVDYATKLTNKFLEESNAVFYKKVNQLGITDKALDAIFKNSSADTIPNKLGELILQNAILNAANNPLYNNSTRNNS